MTSSPSYDAIIVGGGPAGATAGNILARAGWRVAIVEKDPFPRRKVCGDFLSAPTLSLLAQLGLARAFTELAGPEIRRIAILEGKDELVTPMPQSPGGLWGRALEREHLDFMLLHAANQAGAQIWQPWQAVKIVRSTTGWSCHISSARENKDLVAPLVILATGSWGKGAGALSARHSQRDLLAFKAYYREGRLPRDLMPLLVFPGGYGGLVNGRDRISLSCCVRRSALRRLRRTGQRAADAVLQHILQSCEMARPILAGAACDGQWLAAGPVRPGIRATFHQGVFHVGNMAGEAHPIIAEGMSLAIQSSWLLCDRLIARQDHIGSRAVQADIGRAYQSDWSAAFALRIRASSLFAALAVHPLASAMVRPLAKSFPSIFGFAATLSGKSKPSSRLAAATPVSCRSRTPDAEPAMDSGP